MAVVLNRSRLFCLFSDVLKPLTVCAGFRTANGVLRNSSKSGTFDDPRVKSLLKRMTGRNLDKIFSTRREIGVGSPSYKLMTDEELRKAERQIEEEAERYLDMPAIMEERQDSNRILEETPELEGYSGCSFVFTDISDGMTSRDRRIVVRQPDGTLREGRWDERDRMNFMFFQQEGQTYRLPHVLEDEHLQNAFDRDGHVDVLDLVCNQCEPDSADYIRVHRRTYEDICSRKSFDSLRSTRHFGGMVYYFAKEKRLTWLLVDMLKRDLISDASDLIRIFHIIHPSSQSAETARNENLDGMELLRAYVKVEGPRGLMEFIQEDEAPAFA